MNLNEIINDPTASLIDVRTKGEFETDNVAGSTNIPLDTLTERLDDFKSLSEKGPIVVFCLSGGRSGSAKAWLEARGVKNVHNGGGYADVKIHKL